MDLYSGFKNNLLENFRICPEDKILVAVSGGVDSMVLAHLFLQSGLKVGIAHINHALRGSESDKDCEFVRNFAQTHHVPFFSEIIPDTYWAAQQNKQAAARDFRYAFFGSCARREGFSYIATAHHKDDDMETFFMRVKRGTGLTGLAGIQFERGNIIRPLLFATKDEIIEYARQMNISFREDASNLKTDYTRNYFRNMILPLLDQMEIKGREGVYHSLKTIKKEAGLFHDLLHLYSSTIKTESTGYTAYNLQKIKELSHPEVFLLHIFQPFGFNGTQCKEMLSLHTQNRHWKSNTHRVDLDNAFLYVATTNAGLEDNDAAIQIEKPGGTAFSGNDEYKLFIHKKAWPSIKYIIDPKKTEMPLTIRPWHTNDVFFPVAMKGKKKDIKKIISERKIPVPVRKKVKVLVNGDGRIIALLPHILSFHFVKPGEEESFLDLEMNGVSLLYPKA